MPAILAKDGGRLALLYDAVAHMDAARQKFALGLWIEDPGMRLSRFKALYAACAGGLAAWRPDVRPFARILYDASHLLLITRVSADGRPGQLGWTRFWQRALVGERLPARPAEDTADVEKGGVLDAAALLETLDGVNASLRRDVAEAWCFGERVFGNASRTSLPDVLVAVRGFRRYRTLVLTLERLGVDNPTVYAAAVSRAERIAGIADANRAATTLSLYQGALALVERARLGRTLDASTASTLVHSLARLPISSGGDDLGSVASWIDTTFLPALGALPAPQPATAASLELRVLAAFAGRRRESSSQAPTAEYQGMRYRVDPSIRELARTAAIREKQHGASLDAALAFVREVRSLAAAASATEDVGARLARLEEVAAPLFARQLRAMPEWNGGARLHATMTEAARDLEAMRKAGNVRTIESRISRLAQAADAQLGQVLASIAYAAVLPGPASTALMVGDPSLLHDWGLNADEFARARSAWALPSEERDSKHRWHVHGSLLALDLCLGTQALHRLSTDAPPGPPTMSEDDARGFTEAAVLSNTFDYRDDEMARFAAAIRCGRERVAALAANPARLTGVAAGASLDESRRELLSWALVHEPDRVAGFFSVAELLRLGGLPAGALAALDAWGASGVSSTTGDCRSSSPPRSRSRRSQAGGREASWQRSFPTWLSSSANSSTNATSRRHSRARSSWWPRSTAWTGWRSPTTTTGWRSSPAFSESCRRGWTTTSHPSPPRARWSR